jgi:hypothetical protein
MEGQVFFRSTNLTGFKNLSGFPESHPVILLKAVNCCFKTNNLRQNSNHGVTCETRCSEELAINEF